MAITTEELEKKLADIPEVEPDEWDLQMMAEVAADTDNSSVPISEVRARRECSVDTPHA